MQMHRIDLVNVTLVAHNRVLGINQQRNYQTVDAATEVFERLKEPEWIKLVSAAFIQADIYVDDIYDDTVIIDAFERAYPNGDLRQ